MGHPLTCEAAILQVLTRGDAYGLEIIERLSPDGVDTTLSSIFSQGTVYPCLRKMERQGLLESWEEHVAAKERGGRPRKYYRLTAKGLAKAEANAAAISALYGLQLTPEEAT